MNQLEADIIEEIAARMENPDLVVLDSKSLYETPEGKRISGRSIVGRKQTPAHRGCVLGHETVLLTKRHPKRPRLAQATLWEDENAFISVGQIARDFTNGRIDGPSAADFLRAFVASHPVDAEDTPEVAGCLMACQCPEGVPDRWCSHCAQELVCGKAGVRCLICPAGWEHDRRSGSLFAQ